MDEFLACNSDEAHYCYWLLWSLLKFWGINNDILQVTSLASDGALIVDTQLMSLFAEEPLILSVIAGEMPILLLCREI